MDRQTLEATIKAYTIEEDRNLLRYSLSLTQNQKKKLLEYLFITKKQYKAKYYFFPQNCASVLIHVLGLGIEDKEITHFKPIVSPPHSLLALLVRKGIAKPVYPAFYSYHQKGYIVQDYLFQELQKCKTEWNKYNWSNLDFIYSNDEDKRIELLFTLRRIANEHPESRSKMYKLAGLFQEAEMAFSFKDLECENYTSKVTSEARHIQREIIRLNQKSGKLNGISIDKLVETEFIPEEKEVYNIGYPHTKLLNYRFGLGGFHSQYTNNSYPLLYGNSSFTFAGSLFHQEMGSISNLAMQRSSYVELGGLSLSITRTNGIAYLNNWYFTGLKLQKFRDRLNQVPSYWKPQGKIGLGLTVLDFYGIHNPKFVDVWNLMFK